MKSKAMHVVIVGIDRYEARELEPLAGARNDAIDWYRFCVQHLLVPPQNIAVLAHPALTPRELGPEAELSRLRGASRAEIVEEAKRLADAASTGVSGLLTFSGHGLALGPDPGGVTGTDLSLCPTDTRIETGKQGDLTISGTLRFAQLSEIFRSQDSRDNVTVFLDTCYSDGPMGRLQEAAKGTDAAALRANPRVEEAMKRAAEILRVESFTNRLLLGTRHWMPAYEIEVGGKWRGAASFALRTMMERWRTESDGSGTYIDVSHSDLLARTRDMLGVLGVDQVPTMWGARRLDELPVLRPGLKFEPGETSEAPDALDRKRQCPIDPENIYNPVTYIFTDSKNNAVLQVVAMGYSSVRDRNGNTWEANTEYWYLLASSFQTVLDATGLTMSGADSPTLPPTGTSFTPSSALLVCRRNISQRDWSTGTYTGSPANATLFKAPDPSKSGQNMGLLLNFNASQTTLQTIWFKSYDPSDGKAFEWGNLPSFTNTFGTDTSVLGDGAKYHYTSQNLNQ